MSFDDQTPADITVAPADEAPAPAAAPAKRTRTRTRAPRKGPGHDAEVARKAIERYRRIESMDPIERQVLAAVLESDDASTSLAVAATTAKADMSIIETVETISVADDLEAVIEAAALAENKTNLRTAWHLVDADGEPPLRATITVAAASLVRAVRAMPETRISAMRSALAAVN